MATDNEDNNVSALNFNIAPYYDDFDKDKKFVKTLFKPSVSVQARELTQLQSVLQNQISNLADGNFKDGTMVVPVPWLMILIFLTSKFFHHTMVKILIHKILSAELFKVKLQG